MKKGLCLLCLTIIFLCGCNQRTSERKLIGLAIFSEHVTLNKIRDSFKNKMDSLGYTPSNGWIIHVESANAKKNECASVAEELLNEKPVVIVSISTPSTKGVLEKNNGRIPHIYSFVSFPKGIGIDSNTHNTTGLSDGVDFKMNFDLIRSIIPHIKKLGMVYSDEPNAIKSKDEMLILCKSFNVQFIGQFVQQGEQVKQATESLSLVKVDAIFVGADNLVVDNINAIADVAEKARIPVFATDEESIKAGGLAGISVDYDNFGKQTALVTDQAIKNKSAEGLRPIQYIGKDLVVNLQTAKKIKINIPDSILTTAKKVF